MLTLVELQKIANSDPKNLPVIYVHHNNTWTGPVMVDTKGRIHCNDFQLFALKKDLPIVEVGQIGPTTTEFKIALERHHLLGGVDKPFEDKTTQNKKMAEDHAPDLKMINEKALKRKTDVKQEKSDNDTIH